MVDEVVHLSQLQYSQKSIFADANASIAMPPNFPHHLTLHPNDHAQKSQGIVL
jgi:hypothetical protein